MKRADEYQIGDDFFGSKVSDIVRTDEHTYICVKIGSKDLISKFQHSTRPYRPKLTLIGDY